MVYIYLPFEFFFESLFYKNDFLLIFKNFFPEIVLFFGIFLYFFCFLTVSGRLVKNNFMIYLLILLGILSALLFSPHIYNYECLLISFDFTWFIKLTLLSSVIGFTLLHYFQVSFAWYKNNKIDLDLGSKYFELNLFLLVATLASFFLISANDFIIFYVNIEILNICFTLICYLIYEKITIEATLKYFFTNIIFSYFILLGICFIYFSFFSFNFYKILDILAEFVNCKSVFYNVTIVDIVIEKSTDNNLYISMINRYLIKKLYWLLLGLFFIFFGLLGKIGLFPGFFWVLDVYGNISVLSNVILSIFPKIIYISMICHLGYCFEIYSEYYLNEIFLIFFYLAASLTLIYATIFTLNQWRIKRFLAGSSLVNLSFIIFLVGEFLTFSGKEAISTIFFFL